MSNKHDETIYRFNVDMSDYISTDLKNIPLFIIAPKMYIEYRMYYQTSYIDQFIGHNLIPYNSNFNKTFNVDGEDVNFISTEIFKLLSDRIPSIHDDEEVKLINKKSKALIEKALAWERTINKNNSFIDTMGVWKSYGLKGDMYHKEILSNILIHGTKDVNPRPHYADGTPAYTLQQTAKFLSFDLQSNESPLITLRPIAWKSAIKEMLWIWQDQSNDLDLLKDKYGITWWDNWEIDHDLAKKYDMPKRTIGACYGYTVRRHNLINNLLDSIQKDPFGRRHIASLWQEDDFKLPHALKPCAFMIMCTVRREPTCPLDLLDMTLTIRSSDFATAGVINMIQYMALHYMIAAHCKLMPNTFNCFIQNVHIYDRHIDAVKELLNRPSLADKNPTLVLNPDKTDFFSFTPDDFVMEDYPIECIKKINPQIDVFKNEIAI